MMRWDVSQMTRGFLRGAALALCLFVPAPAAQEKRPPVRRDAAQLRRALRAALKGEFEIVRDELTRRSTHDGAGAFWLVHVRPKRAGHFSLKYTYRYDDPFDKTDRVYTHVTRAIPLVVGPRACWRRPQVLNPTHLPCLGDTVILPIRLDAYKTTYTGHSFVFTVHSVAAPDQPAGPEPWQATLMRAEDGRLRTEPVPNPLAEHLKYIGSAGHVAPHRNLGFTVNFYATFEAVSPGRFNISLSARPPGVTPAASARDASVPVIVVARGTPVTWLAAREDVRETEEGFGSTWGDHYYTSPVIMQPGERLTLGYGGFSVRGRDPEGGIRRYEQTLDTPPVIRRLPFNVERDDHFNEWIVDHLPK
jgi:hypothetical protein